MFVNSLNKEHLERVVDSVLSLHDRRVAFISSLQHIGDYRNLSAERERTLIDRNILVFAATPSAIPAQVRSSPAWIVETPKGIFVLEGFMEISAMINSFGDFDLESMPLEDPIARIS